MSGFKSFLKAAGEAIANGLLAYVNLPPLFHPSLPSTGVLVKVSELDQMMQAAVGIEAVGKSAGLTGAQKMAALIPQVAGILNSSLALAGHEAGDPDLMNKAVAEYAQASVDFANALKPKGVPGA